MQHHNNTMRYHQVRVIKDKTSTCEQLAILLLIFAS
jgi:hypothetical protein